MTEQTKVIAKQRAKSRASLVYGKSSAFLGVTAGLALVFGTPVMVSLFNEANRTLVNSLPEWTVPIMLFIGMGGGVLITLVSSLFALLIPSRVIPKTDAEELD